MKNSRALLSVAAMVAVFVGVPARVHGSPQSADPHHSSQGAPATGGATTPDPRQHMTRMMTEMNAADAKLEELVQAMNAAQGAEKPDAIAALVTALVQEQVAMRGSMAMMMTMMNMMSTMHKMDKMSARDDMATGKPKP